MKASNQSINVPASLVIATSSSNSSSSSSSSSTNEIHCEMCCGGEDTAHAQGQGEQWITEVPGQLNSTK